MKKNLLNFLFLPIFLFSQNLFSISNDFSNFNKAPSSAEKVKQESNSSKIESSNKREKKISLLSFFKKTSSINFQNFQRNYRNNSKIIEGVYLDASNLFNLFPSLKNNPVLRRAYKDNFLFYLKYDFNGNTISDVIEVYKGRKTLNGKLVNPNPHIYYIHSDYLKKLFKDFSEKGKKGYYFVYDRKQNYFTSDELFIRKDYDPGNFFKIKSERKLNNIKK